MRRISIKGGYGEHGRSCFMVEYGTEGRCYIVDCGIMDTDPVPWPAVTPEELAQADFLFLTHCHKACRESPIIRYSYGTRRRITGKVRGRALQISDIRRSGLTMEGAGIVRADCGF